jgi:nucleoside-diphosphate-sugar epimerase
MNIAVIGATGKLGRALMKIPGTIECPIRFEDSKLYQKWFAENQNIDTVWHVGRACRKTGVRRDYCTFFLETNAMKDLLKSRASECVFVYASSKIVYGLGGLSKNPKDHMTADNVSTYFADGKLGVFNCPIEQTNSKIDIDNLDSQRTIYALTKLFNENLVKKHCKEYKILRIWDIVP